jgi:alpha-methylacyl-CoA racemase
VTANNARQGAPAGPLVGLRVMEMSGLGPGPHCAMLLANLGADVIRFERPEGGDFPNPVLDRGRATVSVDLKNPADVALCRRAAAQADVLIEGYRPGVMERLGLGPDPLMADNPRLVYARLTGWGQNGPMAPRVGHDLNYIALAGALHHFTPGTELPNPPLNLVGDYGGGSLYAAFGIMAALWERTHSGQGQVIDAAIVDGTASMMAVIAGFSAAGSVQLEAGRNVMSGAAPFYRTYRCADGLDITIAALEPRFYREVLRRIGAPAEYLHDQFQAEGWPARCDALAAIFVQKTRDEWCQIFDGADACFAPVLSVHEASRNAHLRSRGTYLEHDGVLHAAPAPRFSRTPGAIPSAESGAEPLQRWGLR